MRTFVPLTAAALGLGLLLAGGPAATADDRGNGEWKALLVEMQAEGLLAARSAGWKSPAPARPAAGHAAVATPVPGPISSSTPPKGIGEPPCSSP